MRISLALAFFLNIFFSLSSAQAEPYLYLGAKIGDTTQTQSSGGAQYDSQLSYGFDGYYILDHWMMGLGYTYFAPSQTGNDAVNVSQQNNWAAVRVKYLFLEGVFSPYVGLGGGALFQSVTTNVLAMQESETGTSFIKDVGVGLFIRVTDDIGLDLGAKYFQYSNVGGFDFAFSIGYTPQL